MLDASDLIGYGNKLSSVNRVYLARHALTCASTFIVFSQ